MMVVAVLPAIPAAAQPSPLTSAQLAALDPAAQAALLEPLRAAAAALDTAGREHSDVYAGVAIDAPQRRTDLYLTDPGQAPALVSSARAADPGLTLASVAVHRAAYTSAMLDAASARVVGAAQAADPVYAAYPAPDASSVRAEVGDPVAARRASRPEAVVATATGVPMDVPVTFVAGHPRLSHSWNDVKWHDSTPFIGGDVLTPNGHSYCTAGLPAVRAKDRHPVMITAAHCFAQGQRVYTAGGATRAWGNGRTGNYVGTVTARNFGWDAEVLDGANNNADESDTSGWKPLTSVAYSYTGDYVCHSGAKSAYEGHPTPCGIRVTIDDLYFSEDGPTVRGVEGEDVHGWGSVSGDSGGTVFAVEEGGRRQLRGLVSSGGADGTADQKRVDWPEAVDIFGAFGLRLNPTT